MKINAGSMILGIVVGCIGVTTVGVFLAGLDLMEENEKLKEKLEKKETN